MIFLPKHSETIFLVWSIPCFRKYTNSTQAISFSDNWCQWSNLSYFFSFCVCVAYNSTNLLSYCSYLNYLSSQLMALKYSQKQVTIKYSPCSLYLWCSATSFAMGAVSKEDFSILPNISNICLLSLKNSNLFWIRLTTPIEDINKECPGLKWASEISLKLETYL